MTYEQALLYGAVQGITEYLPVSSSAHLILLPKFLHTEDPGLTFDVFLHLGTVLATMVYFWREWHEIFKPIARPKELMAVPNHGPNWKTITLATLPALFVGALLHKYIESVFRGNMVLAVTLPLGGVLLWAADRFMAQKRPITAIRLKDAFLIGCIQCCALVPGISRSGSTMTGARFLGLDRAASARFSFLISAPVTAAAIIYEMRHWQNLLHSTVGPGPLIVAGLSSFFFGMIAIGGLIKMLKHFGYFSFALYRCALGVVIYYVLGV